MAEGRHDNGTAHHEGKARIPGSEDVEEGQHLRRVDHLRDDQAKAKEQSSRKR
jgi:hypothetical protein